MKIVIVGAGKIGSNIIKHVAHEEHEVVVVDNNPQVIEDVVNAYDVIGICGKGVNYDILKKAGAETADLVIACTESDEVNMLTCLIAKKLGTKNTIARVRDHEYTNQIQMMKESLGITMTFNPELETAREIMRILNFPGAVKAEAFAQGNVDMVEFVIPESSALVGVSLYQVRSKFQVQVLISAVIRGDEVIIPSGSFTFMSKDRIFITADRYNSRSFMNKLSLTSEKIKKILIIGGGRIGYYLAKALTIGKYDVKIIDNDLEKCKHLSELLPSASIVYADGTNQNVLKDEGMEYSDAIICLTGIDEANIIISMYANKMHVKKIITKVNKKSFGELLESIDMASVISSSEVVASQILSYIRSVNNKRGNNIKTLLKMVDDRIEAVEFLASSSSKVLHREIKDLKIKPNILISCIIHEGEVIIPNGDSIIETNDSVIVVTSSEILNDLDDILV